MLRAGKLSPDGSLALIHAVGHLIDHLLCGRSWFNKYLHFHWTGRFAAVKYNNREIPRLQLDRDNQFAGVGSLFFTSDNVFLAEPHLFLFLSGCIFTGYDPPAED